jgi:hypothetical protein
MSLRERLAMKANMDADKLPPKQQSFFGKPPSKVDILKGKIGQKRTKVAEDYEMDDDGPDSYKPAK